MDSNQPLDQDPPLPKPTASRGHQHGEGGQCDLEVKILG